MDVPVFVGIDEQARVGTLQLDARVSLAELAAVNVSCVVLLERTVHKGNPIRTLIARRYNPRQGKGK